MSASAADLRVNAGQPPPRHVPAAPRSRFLPPRATIDPDTSQSWLRRARPVVLSHKWTLGRRCCSRSSALVLQVQIPNVLNHAVTYSLQRKTGAALALRVDGRRLGVAAGVAAYISRLFLMRTAYAIEFDLRNLIYEHLTRMSFGFYDRVQSGQLISRANSDIRSVQMYLTFAPAIIVQCLVAVVAFIYMLTISVPLAFVAMSTTPFVFVLGVRMRRDHVPGLVADLGAAGRSRDDRRREHQRRPRREVVRRRAARADHARRRRRTAQVGVHQGRRSARPLQPRRPEPAAGRACPDPARSAAGS